MTIEPGEVIAVLAAATLLALEGLISQVILRLAPELIQSHSVDSHTISRCRGAHQSSYTLATMIC